MALVLVSQLLQTSSFAQRQRYLETLRLICCFKSALRHFLGWQEILSHNLLVLFLLFESESSQPMPAVSFFCKCPNGFQHTGSARMGRILSERVSDLCRSQGDRLK
ncbi:unnamed protein product [Effrenium voratum]|nr:unnamed protein product [Effrenium voratum]